MRFLIFGAGAMGSLIGALLTQRHAVTLVARPAHARAIRQSGLHVHGKSEMHVRPQAVESVADVASDAPEVVVLTVKSYDTATAVAALESFWHTSTFLSLQNGLGNVELLAERAERVLGGVTYHGVTFAGPGEVKHAGTGETILGPVKGTTLGDAEAIRQAFCESGVEATVAEDIHRVLWTKAVVNACFNPITGLLRLRSGALHRSEHLMESCRWIVEEAVAVARAGGVELDFEGLMERIRAVSSATAENKSSMLQDLERGGRTEIDAINGWIARMGRELGIPVPVNRTLALLVKAAEELGASPFRV
jgi:2-dehydropantoate 2-reductase